MSNSLTTQISKNLAFRFRIPCFRLDAKPKPGIELPEKYQLPSFGEFDRMPVFADLRMGWMADGIYLSVSVSGKKQAIRCREVDLLRSDGLQLWFDTRATHNVHRATKYCHWMMLMPTSSAEKQAEPVGRMIKINRAKEDSPSMNRGKLTVHAKITADGYRLSGHVPAACLFGWDPKEHRELGFNYAIVDSELGWQVLAIGAEFPVFEDPSLWQSLTLED
jgi:hypothetical protein